MTTTLTRGAARALAIRSDVPLGVASRRELTLVRVADDEVAGHLAARRWREVGTAIVLHNGPLAHDQRCRIATINCGPRSALTSFTSVTEWGLAGWGRPEIHVLAPGGTTRPPLRGIVLHRTRDWARAEVAFGRRLHLLGPSLVLAAASFPKPRPGCGILAAAVQQRLCSADDLLTALDRAPRVRHRSSLILAAHDIGQGAHALSEIDLRRLCRRHGLPLPTHQAIRIEPSGRRRYLDAEWKRPGRRTVGVEVDGALHLAPRTWADDQLRQNEVVIGGTLLLRYPSVVVRDEELIVVDQLGRALCT